MLSKPWSKANARSFAETEPNTVPMAYGVDFDAPTEPLPLLPTPAPEPLALAPQEISLYDVIAEIRKNNRVCPQPTRWLEFFRMLEAHAQADGEELPPQPLTGSAWAVSSSLAKGMCFRAQVEWAATHNFMNTTWRFLQALPDGDWHYST